ncbi:Myotubularin- protein 3 [Cichlidogyrus casuarinus]|uniref:Myotubularin- protein 3 n=1 Tax=Cichlidogyrus casuarinus TaxID=1844966 RepID=A0ABD2QDK8_9PLAT
MAVSRVDILESSTLRITAKFGPVRKIKFIDLDLTLEWSNKIKEAIQSLSESNDKLFAYDFHDELKIQRHDQYFLVTPFEKLVRDRLKENMNLEEALIRNENKRLQFTETGKWKLSEANINFKICSSYPQYHFLPNSSDFDLEKLAQHRSHNRFPSVVWRSKQTRAVLVRAAQPCIGLFHYRNEDDEKLVKAIASCCKGESPKRTFPELLIIDCRTTHAAMFNRMRGGGTEHMYYYSGCDIKHMDLPNIYKVQDSFNKLVACLASNNSQNWLSELDGTSWLQYIGQILSSSYLIAHYITKDGLPVMVHCTDGWDRTSQLCSLAKLMMDPFYRTIFGFVLLIEREWLEFGHKFADRSSNNSSERSPVFLQWLDCVYQLLCQFPEHFEFNEQLLIKIGTHLYSGQFGTFLCNTEQDRLEQGLSNRTCSLWNLFLDNSCWPVFNQSYQKSDSEHCLFPETHYGRLKLWTNMYSKSLQICRPDPDCEELEFTNFFPPEASSPVPRDSEGDAVVIKSQSATNSFEALPKQYIEQESAAPISGEFLNQRHLSEDIEIGRFSPCDQTDAPREVSFMSVPSEYDTTPHALYVQQLPFNEPLGPRQPSLSAPVQSLREEIKMMSNVGFNCLREFTIIS